MSGKATQEELIALEALIDSIMSGTPSPMSLPLAVSADARDSAHEKAAHANTRAIDYPAPDTYDKFTPEQIKALCEVDTPANSMFRIMPEWSTMNASSQCFFRLKAYWTLRGAKDPGFAASIHSESITPFVQEWCVKESLRAGPNPRFWRPTSLKELDRMFLPAAIPDIRSILRRCPQMAMIHALRGDVWEPYWWAALSITEHAAPNLSRDCSDGYSGFSDLELTQRVARIRDEKRKPALCSRFDQVNPNVCTACRYKTLVRTPIALGFVNDPKGKGTKA